MAMVGTSLTPIVKMKTPLEDANRELKKVWQNCRPSRDSAEELFHYTSAEGLQGILKGKTLWLSKVSTFNDTSEMLHGGSVIEQVIDEALRSQPPGQNSPLDLEAVAEKGKEFVERLPSHSYAFCFCSRRDRLSQWRAYGAGAAGFQIGFNRLRLEEYLGTESLRVSDPMPMIYGKTQQKKAASCFVSKAIAVAANPKYCLKGSDLSDFNNEFAFLLYLFPLAMKNPSFSEEEEWRILQVGLDQKAVKFRPAHGSIIPYLELSSIPPEVFASVTLGPRVDLKFVLEPMRLFLNCNHLEHVKVRPSKITLRTIP